MLSFFTPIVVNVLFDFSLWLTFFGPTEAYWLTKVRDQTQGRLWQLMLAVNVQCVCVSRACLKSEPFNSQRFVHIQSGVTQLTLPQKGTPWRLESKKVISGTLCGCIHVAAPPHELNDALIQVRVEVPQETVCHSVWSCSWPDAVGRSQQIPLLSAPSFIPGDLGCLAVEHNIYFWFSFEM